MVAGLGQIRGGGALDGFDQDKIKVAEVVFFPFHQPFVGMLMLDQQGSV